MVDATLAPLGPDTPLQRHRSEGGLELALPAETIDIHSSEHAAVLVLVDPATPTTAFAPTCTVTEVPEPLALERWARELGPVATGLVLLEAAEDASGFAATFAQCVAGTSVTGVVRAFALPGRTVVVTVQVASAIADRALPLAARIADSLEVEGLT